jgi:hypothetical protein
MCILSSFYMYLYTYFLFVMWSLFRFMFDMLFLFFRNAPFTLQEAVGALSRQQGGCSKRSYSSIFHIFLYFRSPATFAGESSETILFFVVPRGSEEGPVKLDVRIE